jgi:hypothetical protein
MNKVMKVSRRSALLGLALAISFLPVGGAAQDYRPPQPQDQDQNDPPTRVARLGYMEGSVSFDPAGETDWVGAVPNRPMTTGDKLWADQNSRAELQLGSAAIRLSANTGVSFLNLDDHTVQLQLSAGIVNLRVRRLHPDDDFEIDTPNLAFTITQPGSYRLETSPDGDYTAITIRSGNGEATGNGQSYTLYSGQLATFSGTDSLSADVEQIGEPDQFDTWADSREYRYDHSRSAQYLSRDVVGFDDLDDNGDWRDDPNYGHVWYPNRVDEGWAPYHTGHWAWIDPWGYTWVDDASWGYAPFHYGRWVYVGGRWGWIAGPPAVEPVYAPALVVFIGGGPGGWGGNVGWFPLGPREVFVPSYPVSRGYMNQVNVSNTTVNVTTVTNVYNTNVINKTTTNITNVTYVNRTVQGAVTAVPQNTFAGAQPVARAAIKVTPQQIASAPVSGRVAVAPTRQAVLGAHATTAGHVAAPPAAVMNRQVVAKKTPPPPPVPFAQKQQAMAAHPGQPLARQEVASLRPANAAAAHPMVKVAPLAKPAMPTTGHPPAGHPAPPSANHPASQPAPPAAKPAPPANSPPAAQPAHPAPAQPSNRREPNQPEPNRPAPQPSRPAPVEPAHPAPAQPSNRREPNQPEPNRPAPQPSRPAPAEPAHPQPSRPAQPPPARNEPAHPAPAPRPQTPPAEHPPQHTPPPAAAKPAPPPKPKPQTPVEKKREQEKPPGE